MAICAYDCMFSLAFMVLSFVCPIVSGLPHMLCVVAHHLRELVPQRLLIRRDVQPRVQIRNALFHAIGCRLARRSMGIALGRLLWWAGAGAVTGADAGGFCARATIGSDSVAASDMQATETFQE